MAKSTRSKVKRHFRAKKREEGVYAATEAARLHRLSMKLRSIATAEKDENEEMLEEGTVGQEDEGADGQAPLAEAAEGADAMELDTVAGPSSEKRISTHGPRNSRREQWRASKGMSGRPNSKGMNRQGGIAARRKAGRSQRRR